jgi:hypothetical protein
MASSAKPSRRHPVSDRTGLRSRRAPGRRQPGRAGRLLSIPIVAIVFVAGVWVAGGVLSDDFRTSQILVGAWFAIGAIACVAVVARRRELRLPVLATYVVVAGAVGAYLAYSSMHTTVVDERVAVGGAGGDTELAHGALRSGEHHASGRAAVVRLPDGRRLLTFTALDTSPGPDLRVRIVPGDTYAGAARGAVDLGALKGNKGDQQYAIPAGLAVSGHSAVIWCRAFSAPFGSALLRSP